jgi:iron complex transport system substrate-binding protein
MRIVSLLPSTTEIVCDLGLADQLLGVTIECNWPTNVRNGREIVVGTFSDPSMTPAEIDAIVRQRMADGLDLYELDDDALARCNPDLILSQDLCRVCAVASGDVDAAVQRLNCDANVLQIDPQNLDEVIESINTIAVAAGVPERGRKYCADLRQRLQNVERAVSRIVVANRPKVFVLEWIDPPFGAGHWVPDIVTAAGGIPVVARPGQRSVQTTWDEIADASPDVVLVSPCGYGLDASAEQAQEVLRVLPAQSQVWAIDADAVMVRPGPRLVDGVEAIAAMLHGIGEVPEHLLRRVR